MNVVICGDRLREGDPALDIQLTNALVNHLKVKYADLQIITTNTDRGVGKYLRNRCGPPGKHQKYGEVDFTEIAIKIFLRYPTKQALNTRWRAKNATLLELGEEFHLCPMDGGRDTQVWDLLNRVKKAGLPYALYGIGEIKPKETKIDEVQE